MLLVILRKGYPKMKALYLFVKPMSPHGNQARGTLAASKKKYN